MHTQPTKILDLMTLGVVSLGLLIVTAAAADSPSPDERFFAAISTNPAALESLLAERFVYRTLRGSTIDKRALIEELASGRTRVTDPRIADHARTMQDRTLVSTGVVTVEATGADGTRTIRSRFTHVWVQAGDHWQLLFRESIVL